MTWPYLIATALSLGWMLSPEVLVRLGSGVAADRTLFLAALAMAALLTARGVMLIRHPALRNRGHCELTGLLVQGIGRLPAMSLLLASRTSQVALLSTGLLVTAGFAFNEVFLYWFPNFGFAFLLLGLITLLQLAGERFAVMVQPFFVAITMFCLLVLCVAGLGGPASSRPVSMDIGFSFTPDIAVGALLLFLGTDYATPQQHRDSRLPALAALLSSLLLFLFWAMLSLQYVPAERLLSTTTPHMVVAREILGESGRLLMGIAVISGVCGAVNALFLSACSTFAELAQRNLLVGHRPGRLRRHRYVLLFGLLIAGLVKGGLAGHAIIESYIQASLLLWLLLFAMSCVAAGRILHRHDIDRAWHGFVVGGLLLLASVVLAVAHPQTIVVFRFTLVALLSTALTCAFWLWKQPAYNVVPSQPQHQGDE